MFENIAETMSNAFSVFSTFKFTDILDIFFVTLLIFGLIRIIRETRAIQLLKGIALLVVGYAVIRLIGMESSSYILNALFSDWLLIIIILFSGEIRHALEQIGKASVSKISFFSMLNSELQEKQIQTKQMIDEVCRACSKFSDEKTGALLVFEREVLLGEVIDSGILLEADASAELIGNVFFPKSPLHDGAVVVRDAQLHAAGCILPLTKNNAISSALGTRHRAALGMSEVSDAVVIVVSEETGIISLAKGGKLRRNLSDGDIRAVLSESLLKDEDQSGNILERLRRRIKK